MENFSDTSGVVIDQMGLPQDPTNPTAQNITNNYDDSSKPPPVSGWDSFWSKVKSYDAQAGNWVIQAVKDDYGLLKGATSTVVGDVAAPVQGVIDNAYWKIILVVIVLGGVIYFAGKSGAVKANVIV